MTHHNHPVQNGGPDRANGNVAGEPIEVTFELDGNRLIPHMFDMATGEKKDYIPYIKPDDEEVRTFCKTVSEIMERSLGRPVRYIVPKKGLGDSCGLHKLGIQSAKTRLAPAKIKVAGITVTALLLLVFGGLRVSEQYAADQKSLYESVRYEQAQGLYKDDLGQYGQNDERQAYETAVNELLAIERDYRDGRPIGQAEVDAAKQEVNEARRAYVDEGKRKLREEEQAKAAAEEARKRKEREEQERAERQAAKEAEEQRRREKAEANYANPDYLYLPVCGEQLSAEIKQVIDDISKYHGKVGWSDYSEKSELYEQYADAYVYSHGWTYDHKNPGSGVFQVSEEDVLTALSALAQARRHMVVEQAVHPDLQDESMAYDPNDPFVYVTETGNRFHSKENCRGLNNANETYVVKRSEARAEGFSECQICY